MLEKQWVSRDANRPQAARMQKPQARWRGLGAALLAVAVLSGCASRQVRCDGKLQPINLAQEPQRLHGELRMSVPRRGAAAAVRFAATDADIEQRP